MSVAQNEQVARDFFTWFKACQLAEIQTIIDPQFVDHGAPTGAPRGHEYISQFCNGLWSAFSDLDYRIDDLFAAGDRVCVRFTVSGTHRGAFAGVAATGRAVAWEIFDIFRIVNGVMTDRWGLSDVPGLMRQLRGT